MKNFIPLTCASSLLLVISNTVFAECTTSGDNNGYNTTISGECSGTLNPGGVINIGTHVDDVGIFTGTTVVFKYDGKPPYPKLNASGSAWFFGQQDTWFQGYRQAGFNTGSGTITVSKDQAFTGTLKYEVQVGTTSGSCFGPGDAQKCTIIIPE